MSVDRGYISISRYWADGDEIEIDLDMRTKVIYPIPYDHQVLMNKVIWGHNYVIPTYDREDPNAKNHIALRRGPIMLAQDSRLGYDIDEPICVNINEDGYVNTSLADVVEIPFEHMLAVNADLKDTGYIRLIDYASAGKLWSKKSKLAVWILCD